MPDEDDEFQNDVLEAIHSELTELSSNLSRLDERTERIEARLEDVEEDLENVQSKTDQNARKIAIGAVLASGAAAWFIENVSITLPFILPG